MRQKYIKQHTRLIAEYYTIIRRTRNIFRDMILNSNKDNIYPSKPQTYTLTKGSESTGNPVY